MRPDIAFAYADCGKLPKDKTLEERVALFVNKAKDLAAGQHYKRAEKCLSKALLLVPDSRDLAYFQVRLKAWQADFDGAELLLAKFPEDDPESLSLGAEVRGMRTEHEAANGARFSASSSANYAVESQNQSLLALDFDAAVVKQRKSFSLGLTSVERDFGALRKEDSIIRSAVGTGIQASEGAVFEALELTFSVSKGLDPDFSTKESLSFRQDISWNANWSSFTNFGAKWYPDLYVNVLQGGASYQNGVFLSQASLTLTRAKQRNLASYLSIAYTEKAFVPTLYTNFGRDASSRSYLTGREEEAFVLVGTQVSTKLLEGWKARILYEQRWERSYRMQAFGLALMWAN